MGGVRLHSKTKVVYKDSSGDKHKKKEKNNFNMVPNAFISDLPVGLRQRVEILKALFLGADILIMDEPTAVLTPQEITGLFETLKELRNHGASIR